jgi:putative membrane protein
MQSSLNSSDGLDLNTRLAFQRTWLSEESTTMSWIRTATSLITFGFAIFSFFVVPNGAGHALTSRQLGAAVFAFMLVCIGLLSLVLAAVQRRQEVLAMRALYQGVPPRSLAGVAGAVVAVMGVGAAAILLLDLFTH